MSMLLVPLPENAVDADSLYEVVDGVRVEQPLMSAKSSLVGGRLFSRLDLFVDERGLGLAANETLVILNAATELRRRPDVCFVYAERWPLDRLIPETGDWDVVPDLVVEIASPNDLLSDVLLKVDEYFDCGVLRVWLVDPETQRAYTYRSPTEVAVCDSDGTLEDAELLPGFHLPLKTLFRPPLSELPQD